MAYGSISPVRTRRIPLVFPVAAAISDVILDAADHPMDCEHHANLRYVALANTRASLGIAPWLGNAVGVWMSGGGWGYSCVSAEDTTGGEGCKPLKYWDRRFGTQ